MLLVTRLDRLARSTRDLLNTLATIADREGRLPLAGRRMGRHHHGTWPPDADCLGGLAEFERELIRARTGEGRARAKARGVSSGESRSSPPHQRREAMAARERGEVPRRSRAATTSATARSRG